MKKILLACCAFLCALISFSQAPQGINYQAVARNSTGTLLASQSVHFQFTFLQNNSPVYVERHALTTNAFGLANVTLGQGTVVSGNFQQIGWNAGSMSLLVALDETGGTNFVNLSTSSLLTVPYAFAAQSEIGDNDHDSTNELQQLTLSGDTLFLVPGNSVVLPASNPNFFFFFADRDGDGKGDRFSAYFGPSALPDFVADSTDCDDFDANEPHVVFQDFDGDGFGNPNVSAFTCTSLAGFVSNNTDCNDNNSGSFPQTFFVDSDLDGFGAGPGVFSCTPLPGHVLQSGDCNDANFTINPGAIEACNTIDDDCDFQVDENFNLNSDVNNCGQCGNVCNLPNAIEGCSAGSCFIISCTPGFADCNGNPADGCEVNTLTHCCINGQAIPAGTLQPGSPCMSCQPGVNPGSWTPVSNGTICPGGVCANGTCQ